MFTIAAENIGKSHLHLESLKSILNVIAGLRVPVIHQTLHQLATGFHIKLDVAQSMVEEGRAPCHKGGNSLFDEDCPVYRPNTLNLLERHQTSVHRSGPESPDEGSILCPEAINRPICRTKDQSSFPVCRG